MISKRRSKELEKEMDKICGGEWEEVKREIERLVKEKKKKERKK